MIIGIEEFNSNTPKQIDVDPSCTIEDFITIVKNTYNINEDIYIWGSYEPTDLELFLYEQQLKYTREHITLPDNLDPCLVSISCMSHYITDNKPLIRVVDPFIDYDPDPNCWTHVPSFFISEFSDFKLKFIRKQEWRGKDSKRKWNLENGKWTKNNESYFFPKIRSKNTMKCVKMKHNENMKKDLPYSITRKRLTIPCMYIKSTLKLLNERFHSSKMDNIDILELNGPDFPYQYRGNNRPKKITDMEENNLQAYVGEDRAIRLTNDELILYLDWSICKPVLKELLIDVDHLQQVIIDTEKLKHFIIWNINISYQVEFIQEISNSKLFENCYLNRTDCNELSILKHTKQTLVLISHLSRFASDAHQVDIILNLMIYNELPDDYINDRMRTLFNMTKPVSSESTSSSVTMEFLKLPIITIVNSKFTIENCESIDQCNNIYCDIEKILNFNSSKTSNDLIDFLKIDNNKNYTNQASISTLALLRHSDHELFMDTRYSKICPTFRQPNTVDSSVIDKYNIKHAIRDYGKNSQNYICPDNWCFTSKTPEKCENSFDFKKHPYFKNGRYPGFVYLNEGKKVPCCFSKITDDPDVWKIDEIHSSSNKYRYISEFKNNFIKNQLYPFDDPNLIGKYNKHHKGIIIKSGGRQNFVNCVAHIIDKTCAEVINDFKKIDRNTFLYLHEGRLARFYMQLVSKDQNASKNIKHIIDDAFNMYKNRLSDIDELHPYDDGILELINILYDRNFVIIFMEPVKHVKCHYEIYSSRGRHPIDMWKYLSPVSICVHFKNTYHALCSLSNNNLSYKIDVDQYPNINKLIDRYLLDCDMSVKSDLPDMMLSAGSSAVSQIVDYTMSLIAFRAKNGVIVPVFCNYCITTNIPIEFISETTFQDKKTTVDYITKLFKNVEIKKDHMIIQQDFAAPYSPSTHNSSHHFMIPFSNMKSDHWLKHLNTTFTLNKNPSHTKFNVPYQTKNIFQMIGKRNLHNHQPFIRFERVTEKHQKPIVEHVNSIGVNSFEILVLFHRFIYPDHFYQKGSIVKALQNEWIDEKPNPPDLNGSFKQIPKVSLQRQCEFIANKLTDINYTLGTWEAQKLAKILKICLLIDSKKERVTTLYSYIPMDYRKLIMFSE